MSKSKKTETPKEEVIETVDTAETEETREPVSLTVADLQAQSRVFELAVQRGAFRSHELTTVGGVFDKLNAFLAYVASTSKEAADSAEVAAGAEGAEGEATGKTMETEKA